MAIFFTHLQHNNAPKNQLEASVLDHLQALSNQLIDDKVAFVRLLKVDIGLLNSRFPRCTPVTVSDVDRAERNDSILYLGGKGHLAAFWIHAAKEKSANA